MSPSSGGFDEGSKDDSNYKKISSKKNGERGIIRMEAEEHEGRSVGWQSGCS